METTECISELYATWAGRHATETWTIPVDVTGWQEQTGTRLRFGQDDSAAIFVIFGCHEANLVLAKILAVGHDGWIRLERMC